MAQDGPAQANAEEDPGMEQADLDEQVWDTKESQETPAKDRVAAQAQARRGLAVGSNLAALAAQADQDGEAWDTGESRGALGRAAEREQALREPA